MLNIPTLKFEKSIKYLENELTIQNSNRELLLDVIANINLISKNSTKEDKERLDAVLFEANDLLSQSSNMISDLEHLKLEIETITKELNGVLGDKNLKSRTKEYFIATFSDIKKKITIYTVKFKDVETNVKVQNERVTNFIKANNLQYNFDSTEDNKENGVQFADFSMDSGDSTFSNVEEKQEEVVENIEATETAESVEEDNTSTVQDKVTEEVAIVNDAEKTEEIQEVDSTDLSDEQTDAINNLTSEFKTLLTEVAKGNVKEDVTPIILSYFKKFDNSGIVEEPLIENNNNDSIINETISDSEVISENYFNTNIIDELKNMFTTGITNIEQDIEKRTTTSTDSIEDISNDFVDAGDTSAEEGTAEFMNEIITENETVETELYSEEVAEDEVQEVDETQEVDENEEAEINIEDETSTYDLPSYDDNYMIHINKGSAYNNIFAFDTFNFYQPSNDVVEYEDVVQTTDEVNPIEEDVSENIVEDEVVVNEDSVELPTEENHDDDSLLEALVESENVESLTNEVTVDETTSNDEIDIYQRSEIDDLYQKIAKIKLAQADNESLIISKEYGIILPYRLTELKEYMDSYPGLYASFTDVVEQEFILPYNYFSTNEKKSRFDEAYNLMKHKVGASSISAYRYAKTVSKETDLHPAIIAACRSQRELDAYLYYMQEDELDKFKYFNIYYKD